MEAYWGKLMNIRQAQDTDLDALAVLFDAYRQFYEQTADVERARNFLRARLAQQDSVLLVAVGEAEQLLGFTQLYPTFSSVSTGRIYVLNDLFVASAAHRSGVGRALLNAACEFGAARGALRLSLATAVSNLPAQGLYQAAGWTRNEQFHYFDFALPQQPMDPS